MNLNEGKKQIHYAKKLADGLLNVLYPHRCPVCHHILRNQRGLVCPECLRLVAPIREPFCKKCGRPVSEEQEYCPDCRKRHRSFDEGRGIFLYDRCMQESILLFKYGGRKEYAGFYAGAMVACLDRELTRWQPDLIIPIPMHKRKKRQRGYNQARVVAERLSLLTGIPCYTDILVKIRKTSSQKKLDEGERRKNLRDAFAVTANLTGLKILLVDDVFTTGSTMDAAAEVLKSYGAEKVFFTTVCIPRQE